jgi:hypothetical protein
VANPIHIELEVAQTVRRDGLKGEEKWSLHVWGNWSESNHGVDKETAEKLLTMSDREVLMFVESLDFAQDNLTYAREYGEGIHIMGEFSTWETLEADSLKP